MLSKKEAIAIGLVLIVLIVTFYSLGITHGQLMSEQASNSEKLVNSSNSATISPKAEPTVRAVFGRETVESPGYLAIWILAIAIISGLIIEVTKLKPGWFRIFIAGTYTTLPLVINYYTKNIWISFVVILLQTVILTWLFFNQWKIKVKIKADIP